MVEKINKPRLYIKSFSLAYLLSSVSALAGEWHIDPNLGLTETYTDNVELSPLETQSSLVRQFILGVDANFSSKKLYFSFAGTETLVGFSHNSELNDDYQTLQANALYDIWGNKLQVIANSSITNVSTSDADNGLADLVNGDTVQQLNHSAGLQYSSTTSDYSVSSSLLYSMIKTEDNIGESNGYTAQITSKNGSAARYAFWDIDGNHTNRKNKGFTSETYQIETKVGAITPYKVNPFIRFYNEKITGNGASNNQEAIPSWGPGLRYQAAKHFIIDLSYNYIIDDTQASDDYIAANIDWQPSSRTSIEVSYSKRFFGDSYELDFSHRTKRFTNTVSYHETIDVFDRNNYQQTDNEVWCANNSTDVSNCLPVGEVPIDTSKYQILSVSSLELVEDNEFSLNKRLAWQSQLALARTTFFLNVSSHKRENLTTGVIDNYSDARFSIARRMSVRSDITIYIDYRESVFDKDNPKGPRQEDIYKTLSTTYNRSLASSLNAFLTLQYIDRQSNIDRYTYNEARASINLTKGF
ncbi:MAG: TIGR03016 family PEP-CTERM system-associated outer membrane protein [Colwellia sp.]